MSGSNLQGWWMASSVTEEDIKKLRHARYLTAEISHRLPAQGQVIPSPEPNESVVFVSHFLRGLGFSLDPFVRGLMFYYGLDFHDLAPDSILHISSFIVVCEAFLRITPHFGLWLKTFNVKPKMINGRHAECGGAIISKALMLYGQRVPSRRCPTYGGGSGFTSQLPEVQSGRLPPPSARALHRNWRHGSTRGWTGGQLMTC